METQEEKVESWIVKNQAQLSHNFLQEFGGEFEEFAKEHYKKYKQTLKKGVALARRKREIWINKYLADKFCVYCGESETCSLAFHPDNKEIRKLSRETGLREELRLRVLEKIQSNTIVCLNCHIKLNNGIDIQRNASPIL